MAPLKVKKGIVVLTILVIAAGTALKFFSQTYQNLPSTDAPDDPHIVHHFQSDVDDRKVMQQYKHAERYRSFESSHIKNQKRGGRLRGAWAPPLERRETLKRLNSNKINIHYREDAAMREELNREFGIAEHSEDFPERLARLFRPVSSLLTSHLNHNGHGNLDETELNNSTVDVSELSGSGPLTVCDRNAGVGKTEDFSLIQQYNNCQGISSKSILLVSGPRPFGRTGNSLVEFLHALQYARDHDLRLFVTQKSWVMSVTLDMWMEIEDDDWKSQFEEAFCVKIIPDTEALNEYVSQGYDIQMPTPQDLLHYMSQKPLHEYMESQQFFLRTLFRSYNTGKGLNIRFQQTRDMCSGIKSLFGTIPFQRQTAIYSVIHLRYMEGGPGKFFLGNIAKTSGCDPVAALEMTPDYVKSILEPLGMLRYPIIVIYDGQNRRALKRLMKDPDLGKLISFVPEYDSWVGGDMTLAVMSNVFIGNPASSFSGFIAKSRLALGFGNNYLFRKIEHGKWRTVCGDSCIFDKHVMEALM